MLVETKETCLAHEKKHETESAWLNDLASQQILSQQNTADTLAHGSTSVYSLVRSLKRLCEEVCKVFMELDEFRVKLEGGYGADEGWATSAMEVIEQIRSLLAKAPNASLLCKKDDKELLAVERGVAIPLKLR